MEKQLVILAYYINLKNKSKLAVHQTMTTIRTNMEKNFPEVLQEQTGVIVRCIVVPVEDDKLSRVECIFPKKNDKKAFDKLTFIEDQLKKFAK